MEGMSHSIPISGPDVLTPSAEDKRELTKDEVLEKAQVDLIFQTLEQYKNDRKEKEQEWIEAFAMFMSWIDATLNPFLSNLFIPKTHEAVELLTAFLVGPNQTVNARPEESSDWRKAQVAGKFLDMLWRKVLKARLKIVVWVKQAIVFGNGVMKVGWDFEKKVPWMATTEIDKVYFDFFESDIQESDLIIHELYRPLADVMNDEKYDEVGEDGKTLRSQVIEGGEAMPDGVDFGVYDSAMTTSEGKGKVPMFEVHAHERMGDYLGNRILTLAPTGNGWRILRRKENAMEWAPGEPFRPFVKLRFKVSPISGRAYDTGGVFPTVKIQKAFNGLMNQYFDNVVMINNPTWIKRRGANINPREMVRRAGQIISVGDIDKDIRAENVPDVKQSLIEILNRLDSEFQQASMIVNLLKAVPGSDFATESVLAQENSMTLMKPINDNIQDAMSELGSMLLKICIDNAEGSQTLELFENDREIGILQFEPSKLDARMDIVIAPDRTQFTSKAAKAKQFQAMMAELRQDPQLQAKFPTLKEKIYKEWMQEIGVTDAERFFEEDEAPPMMAPGGPVMPGTMMAGEKPMARGGGMGADGMSMMRGGETLLAPAAAARAAGGPAEVISALTK